MTNKPKPPKVRIARPANRPFQLRYTDAVTKLEVRISVGSRDELDAASQKAALEAKLLLGIDAKPTKRIAGGPNMLWEEFRARYSKVHLSGLRRSSAEAAEVRLDVAEQILKPKRLSDLANGESLHDLQSRLLAGEASKRDARSPQTVKSYMAAVIAAVNWAVDMEWLTAAPRVKKVKVAKRRQMKGRAISDAEFKSLLEAVETIVGIDAAPSWTFTLRGLWHSGLRLDELTHVHWTDERFIVPTWQNGMFPVLSIPASMQKNDTEECIPLLPWFETLLLETPEPQRFGWVFNPMSLETKIGRRVRHQRADSEWIGKVISRIGKASGVVVQANRGDGVPKFASAHDLRRSCAERLTLAGVPEREVAKVLRHSDVATTRRFYAPGKVQESAAIIRGKLLCG